jgi:hypothetical protein
MAATTRLTDAQATISSQRCRPDPAWALPGALANMTTFARYETNYIASIQTVAYLERQVYFLRAGTLGWI